MKSSIIMVIMTAVASITFAQTNLWTDADRSYLLDNLTRSRDELISETSGLSNKQWTFKESAERWSIADVVEHIGIWELLLQREINMALAAGPQPELASTSPTDSIVYGFIMEDKPHITNEYTVPFTFAQPSGIITGEQSKALLLKRRNESIQYLRSASNNLREYFMKKGRKNIHQVYITTFGHMDRHIRQIRKIKADKNYPK